MFKIVLSREMTRRETHSTARMAHRRLAFTDVTDATDGFADRSTLTPTSDHGPLSCE
jgi:hypothetical protein